MAKPSLLFLLVPPPLPQQTTSSWWRWWWLWPRWWQPWQWKWSNAFKLFGINIKLRKMRRGKSVAAVTLKRNSKRSRGTIIFYVNFLRKFMSVPGNFGTQHLVGLWATTFSDQRRRHRWIVEKLRWSKPAWVRRCRTQQNSRHRTFFNVRFSAFL